MPAKIDDKAGYDFSLVDIYLNCKTGELQIPGSKKIRLRTGDESENLSFYEDVGQDTKVSQKTRDMVIETWVRVYGGKPIARQSGRLDKNDLQKMAKKWPEGLKL